MEIPKHGILPGALWPRMTDSSFGHHSYVKVKSEDVDRFPQTVNGLWLPLATIATKDFLRFREHYKRIRQGVGKAAFRGIELDEASGCWVSPWTEAVEGREHTDLLWDIEALDMGGRPLNPKEEKEAQHICDTARCLNPRHYDLTLELPLARTDLGLPNHSLFATMPDGSVTVEWLIDRQTGEVQTLPSAIESASKLRELQLRCLP